MKAVDEGDLITIDQAMNSDGIHNILNHLYLIQQESSPIFAFLLSSCQVQCGTRAAIINGSLYLS